MGSSSRLGPYSYSGACLWMSLVTDRFQLRVIELSSLSQKRQILSADHATLGTGLCLHYYHSHKALPNDTGFGLN